MDDVYYKLAEVANLSFRDSLDYIIAKEMLQHIDTISNMSIDALSAICCTSTASITRFCQKLGYDSFKELKYNVTQQNNLQKVIDNPAERHIEINKAILNTKVKYDYLINQSLLLIDKSIINELIQKLVDNNRIAIFCASHELSAVILFQALLKKYYKKVDVILCNTEINKMDYVLDNVDFILFLTYGGRWMRRSHKLVSKILETDIQNCVICLDDKVLQNYSFDMKIKFNLSEQLEESHFEFFVFLFSVMSNAIILYYDS
ncbi:MAG: hypothetical protein RR512_05030 [Coprobacillus sp.]